MTSGQHAAWLEDIAGEEPDARHLAKVAEKPAEAELRPDLLLFWEAFWRLSSARPALIEFASVDGGGAIGRTRRGAIPFGALDTYAMRLGIDGEAFDDLATLIEEMDVEFRTVNDERERARG